MKHDLINKNSILSNNNEQSFGKWLVKIIEECNRRLIQSNKGGDFQKQYRKIIDIAKKILQSANQKPKKGPGNNHYTGSEYNTLNGRPVKRSTNTTRNGRPVKQQHNLQQFYKQYGITESVWKRIRRQAKGLYVVRNLGGSRKGINKIGYANQCFYISISDWYAINGDTIIDIGN